jgi:L,D-peptidoglycan transpeptidase YkuD (ErfK/YbiS/YcfS/YnhG family)
MLENITSNNVSEKNQAIIQVLNQLQSQQAIVVLWKKAYYADIRLYEWMNGSWQFIDQMPANVGRNGMGKTKEGDQKSPSGIFTLATAFGIAPKLEGSNYPYRMLTPQDYWVDDSRSIDYNSWVRYQEGDPKDWQSAEWLWKETSCYQHAVIINYNWAREPGKGSAIFLHVWKDEHSPTHGCTAVSEGNMTRILKWLDFDKKPVIIQGAYQDVISFKY